MTGRITEAQPSHVTGQTLQATACRRAGFALVSVLAILVLLMVLVLAITSVIHVETRTSASGRDLLLARQNALLGLDIAIGQLQEYAGKDQAVTFPATTYYPTKDVTTGTGPLFDDATFGYRAKAVTAKGNSTFTSTYLTPSERTQWDNALKDWWNASRNPRWTGIMDASLRVDRASRPNASSANATPLAAQRYEDNPATKFGEPKRDQLPVWLVSGNEKFTIDQENDTAYPQGYFTPDTALPDPDADPSVVWLVGEGSSTRSGKSTDGLDGWVKVRKQKVLAPAADAGGNNALTGHYAYWVGDEATKANFAARDRTSTDDASYPNDGLAKTSKQYRNRLQVPQRIGWENISISGNTTTQFQDVATFSPNDPYLENISTSKEIGLLQAIKKDDALTQQVKDAAKNNFHSLTAFSKSLLTDTALGGLKKDLTVFLEGTGGPSGNSTIMDPARYLPNDPRLGGNNTGFPEMPTDPRDAKLPLWSDVKSWHGAMGTGEGEVTPQPGIAPVFANFQIFFAVTHDGPNVQFHVLPMIALWNPYDSKLTQTTYTLQWRHNFKIGSFGFAVFNPDCPPTPFTINASGDRVETNAGTKFRDYFISPFARIGSAPAAPGESAWFTASDKFSTKPFDTMNNYWPLQQTNFFSPFDKNPTPGFGGLTAAYDGFPLPTDSAATWVTYQIPADQSEFAPGEVKVFTVDGMQKVDDPAALHSGATVIQLKNGLDKDYPSSYYFDFAKNLKRNPKQTAGASWPESPGDPVTNTDDVRWYGEYKGAPAVGASIRLKADGTTLWTNYYSGNPSPEGVWLSYNIEGVENPSASPPSRVTSSDDPSLWRKVYSLDEWPSIAKGAKNTRAYDSAIFGFFRSDMSPFLTGPESIFHVPGIYKHIAIGRYYRAYAVFNPFASEGMDLIQNLDYARADRLVAPTNFDGFTSLRPLNSNSEDMIWDNNHTTGTNGKNGFAGFSWQATDANDNLGLSTLQVRLVRPAEINTVSLGQLQQVNLGRYFWQPSFVLGNSEASPYVDRSRIAGLQKYPISMPLYGPGTGKTYEVSQQFQIWPQALASAPSFASPHPNDAANQHIDLSYLVNENVWDSYFLSTIPQSGAIAMDNSTPMNNGRHRFRAEVTPTDAEVKNWLTSAAFLENHGALNVNSTSVEAWKALFTAFRRLSITGDGASNPDNTVPISRTLSPTKGPIGFTETTRVKADYGADSSAPRNYGKLLGGFRYLTDAQIQTLAERIVDEVRLRGPFLSLADYVNRRLVSPQGADDSSSDWYKGRTMNSQGIPTGGSAGSPVGKIGSQYDPFIGMSGLNGAMQRAINLSGINGGINDPIPDVNNRAFGVIPKLASNSTSRPMQQFANVQFYLDTEHLAGAPVGEVGQLLSHSPGFVTQGDLMAMVGPALTPRGDTFMIRTYGDVVDKTGKVLSRAYIEAIVQRVADPVTPAGAAGADKWRYTDKFGRRFKVVNLRWLRAEDI